MSVNEVEKARKVLGLGESATIPEIKEAYRKLSLKYHPDKCAETDRKECEAAFKEINNANRVLIDHCLNFRIPFKKISSGTISREGHIREHLKRFYDGWWGNLGDE
ncbi:MAG: DnaJ domain-containing protein [Candidatus Omnitrophica bacterium]|nr:DnaJ domain-containing protein [Candidatus Omnitrophota bacterium]